MKANKIILVCMCTLFLIGCSKSTSDNSDRDTGSETEIITENNIEEKVEAEKSEAKKTMKNLVAHKNDIKIEDNIDNTEASNNIIVDEYIRGVNLVKEFCENNSLELTYEEPIEHRISRFKQGNAEEEMITHLENLYAIGAESVSYFTNEPELNVELGTENNYTGVEYKAAVANINGDFNFKDSKLNEFRSSVVNSAEIDFEKLNEFIQGVYNKKMTIDMRFINKIDEYSYEIIRVEGNNCYYKFVCDPYSNIAINN